jgi:anti-sigma B factor antagonist
VYGPVTPDYVRYSVGFEHPSASTVVVVVSGEVDLASAADFEDALAHAVHGQRVQTLIVDLTHVTFIDSTGLTALVRAFERQRWAGGELALVANDSRVTMMLEVSRLDRLLRRFDTRAEAIAGRRGDREHG